MMVRMMAAVVSRGSGTAAALRAIWSPQDRHHPGLSRRLVHRRHGGLVIGVWMGNDDNRPMKG